MNETMVRSIIALTTALLLTPLIALHADDALETNKPKPIHPIRERLIVLSFDDSVASHATFVAPMLKEHGFGATFFITEGFEFLTDKEHYMTWEQIQKLHADGFEIGNHTRRHAGVATQMPEQLTADVEFIEQQCVKYSIPKPVSFCYPGYQN